MNFAFSIFFSSDTHSRSFSVFHGGFADFDTFGEVLPRSARR